MNSIEQKQELLELAQMTNAELERTIELQKDIADGWLEIIALKNIAKRPASKTKNKNTY